MNKQIDRDKSQSRQIQLTEAVISDRVDSLVILPTKKLVNVLITWTTDGLFKVDGSIGDGLLKPCGTYMA